MGIILLFSCLFPQFLLGWFSHGIVQWIQAADSCIKPRDQTIAGIRKSSFWPALLKFIGLRASPAQQLLVQFLERVLFMPRNIILKAIFI